MREIKFRVWNQRHKEMRYWGFMEPEMFTGIPTGAGLSIEECATKSMQYTGLKDKNEKEIYEGDIVRLIEPNRLYTVEWLEYTFKLVHADPKLDRMHWGSIQRIGELGWSIEVIGNVHEHPHFLK